MHPREDGTANRAGEGAPGNAIELTCRSQSGFGFVPPPLCRLSIPRNLSAFLCGRKRVLGRRAHIREREGGVISSSISFTNDCCRARIMPPPEPLPRCLRPLTRRVLIPPIPSPPPRIVHERTQDDELATGRWSSRWTGGSAGGKRRGGGIDVAMRVPFLCG